MNDGRTYGDDGNIIVRNPPNQRGRQRGSNNQGNNPFQNNGIGVSGYRPYVNGGSEFRPTGAGPYCAWQSKSGADKASESKTFEVQS